MREIYSPYLNQNRDPIEASLARHKERQQLRLAKLTNGAHPDSLLPLKKPPIRKKN